MFKKILSFLIDPKYRFSVLDSRGFFDRLSDEKYLRLKWQNFYGKSLNLDDPQTLCEKLQWLKLYCRRPEFTTMADKYEAKRLVAKRFGEEHVIPTLGVWENANDIDFSLLPDQFVLKPTHDSGGFVICRDKKSFDIENARRVLNASLKKNYFLTQREWPYKHIKPRIIAEPLIEQLGKPESLEYKATCFNGKVAFVTICSGIAHAEYEKRKNDHFDKDFNKLNWYVNYKPAEMTPKKPKQWKEIIDLAEALSEGVPYLRVDTYVIDEKVVFGEMTFFTWAGFMHFEPEEWDLKLGKMLKLPDEKHIMD